MKSALLTLDKWDFCLDASSNWAIAKDPYALAQDVACSIRTFLGECWYDTTKGVAYFTTILGKTPPISVLQQLMVDAAVNARPSTADLYVKSATCVVTSVDYSARTVEAQIQFTGSDGSQNTVSVSA